MNTAVKSIAENSPASRVFIKIGDVLKKINGNGITDILDYKFYSYDAKLFLEMQDKDGRMKLISIKKREGEDLGLEFHNFLMDEQRSCANKCIFCFIDQLPKGMRSTLYYKDDDVRLSFLQGNYITLTNLSDVEIERIVRLKISPINISVHTLDKNLRKRILNNKYAGEKITALYDFANAGITLNCQIVLCPGVNDGAALVNTMEGLYRLIPSVKSVSVVPVGLTKFREELYKLEPFDEKKAYETIRAVDNIGRRSLAKTGSRVFYCSDELYLKAGCPIPDDSYYEDYPQLENGIGMLRLFITEFTAEMKKIPHRSGVNAPFSIATGIAAADVIKKLLKDAAEKYKTVNGRVYVVENKFFGDMITVSGLVTGGDIARQLKGLQLGNRLLIPRNMLKNGEELFLDDYTVTRLSKELGVPIRIVEQNGGDLLHAVLDA